MTQARELSAKERRIINNLPLTTVGKMKVEEVWAKSEKTFAQTWYSQLFEALIKPILIFTLVAAFFFQGSNPVMFQRLVNFSVGIVWVLLAIAVFFYCLICTIAITGRHVDDKEAREATVFGLGITLWKKSGTLWAFYEKITSASLILLFIIHGCFITALMITVIGITFILFRGAVHKIIQAELDKLDVPEF